MILIICIVIAFAALVCYASCSAASRADHISEEYWQHKISETDTQKKIK